MQDQTGNNRHPRTFRELKQLIAGGAIQFPPQLQQVARRMLEQPELIAFESAATVAKKCSVSQTTVARLGSHLGLGTYRKLKKLCGHYVRERFHEQHLRNKRPVPAKSDGSPAIAVPPKF